MEAINPVGAGELPFGELVAGPVVGVVPVVVAQSGFGLAHGDADHVADLAQLAGLVMVDDRFGEEPGDRFAVLNGDGEGLRGKVEDLLVAAGKGVLEAGEDGHGVVVEVDDVVARSFGVGVVWQEAVVGVEVLPFANDIAADFAGQIERRLVAADAVEVDQAAARPRGVGGEGAERSGLRGVAALAWGEDPLGNVGHVLFVWHGEPAEPVDNVAADRFPKSAIVEDGKGGGDAEGDAVDLLVDHLVAFEAAGNVGPDEPGYIDRRGDLPVGADHAHQDLAPAVLDVDALF